MESYCVLLIPLILISDRRNASKTSKIRWWALFHAHTRSVENSITMSCTIFYIWDVTEMFDQVACFILSRVITLSPFWLCLGVTTKWGTNNSQFSHLFEWFWKEFFWHILPSCFFVRNVQSSDSLIKNFILISVIRTQENQNLVMILQNWSHSSKRVCMISCCSTHWIDDLGSILIEWNITRIFGTIA